MKISYQIAFNVPPTEASLAIVSIDEIGIPGALNTFVLNEYGYDQKILKQLDLKKGYDLFQLNEKRILFVVTVAQRRDTKVLLRENLLKAIKNNLNVFENGRAWLPLMGTGVGGLTYQESWELILSVFNELKDINSGQELNLVVALPDDEKAKEFYDELSSERNHDTTSKVMELIKSEGLSVFLVGSSWDGNDQAERFYSEGIWESGYDEKYSHIINRIKGGDIVIHKSTYSTRDGRNFLRFKGFGIVKGNFNNGMRVAVEWLLRDFKIDIEDLGYYRTTIAEPSIVDVATILSHINVDSIKVLLEFLAPEEVTDSTYIAGLASDADSGEDYLDIMPDVNAFALLLAAKSFQPPLATALLGRWGSGKSFFMKKLRTQIEKLSDSDNGYFCEGIIHVHFNAWSYMDANLWASITTRIFEGLHYYITNDSDAKNHINEIEKRLTKDLSVTKQELSGLEGQKSEIENQLKELETKKITTKTELDKKIEELRKRSLKQVLESVDNEFKVKDKIENALSENKSVVESIDDFKKIVPEEYWSKPEQMYKKLRSVPGTVKLFTTAQTAKVNRIWFTITVALFIGVPVLLWFLKDYIDSHSFIPGPGFWLAVTYIGGFYVNAVKFYRSAKPFFAKMWKIKEDYVMRRDNALFEFNQQEKALTVEIENKKNELEAVTSQISKVEIVKSTVEFKIGNALSTEALYEFIEKRCQSEDYKKHLGLVSTIRKDFEILSDLFTGHNQEISDTEDGKKFSELFNRPLERIVLYIDDLDRCPEDRVVEVLEAVNLLMAFPLFIIVVGVDPVWVKNALVSKYKRQFGSNDKEYQNIDPGSYLEKIFQIPFHLRMADTTNIKSMLRGLVQVQTLATPTVSQTEQPAVTENTEIQAMNQNESSQQQAPVIINSSGISDQIVFKALNFSEIEIANIEQIAVILGSSPRLIKRFVNIYRIVKSHDYISRESAIKEKDLEVILFVLALCLGKYKKLIEPLDVFLGTAEDTAMFSSFLGSIDESFKSTQSERKELSSLLEEKLPHFMQEEIGNIKKHIRFIRRFALE